MRLSLLMRAPVHEVLTWPLWVVQTYAAFLQREPMPEERAEVGIAQLTAAFGAVHRRAGSPAPRIGDFLLFRDAWADMDARDDGRYSDLDLEMMRQLRR